LEKGKTKSKKKKAKKGMLLPLPLAVAGGLLAGAFAFLWAKKPEYYEVSFSPASQTHTQTYKPLEK
jgi:hypothetical protein